MNALLITFLAGISVLIGVLVTRIARDPHRVERLSIALALGALAALLSLDLFPDIVASVRENGWTVPVLCIVAGVLILKALDLLVPDHHDTAENHDEENAAHIGLMGALAVILHNIVEGMTVYSVAMENLQSGIILAIGIALHNIPMGMMICSTLEHKKRTEQISVISAVVFSTLLGGGLMALLSDVLAGQIIAYLVCIATGMILYLVLFELLPHLIHTKPILPSVITAVIGFLIVLVSILIE